MMEWRFAKEKGTLWRKLIGLKYEIKKGNWATRPSKTAMVWLCGRLQNWIWDEMKNKTD